MQPQLTGGVCQIYVDEYLDAFAAVKEDGSAITWGHKDWGGDSSSVRLQLAGGVQHSGGP